MKEHLDTIPVLEAYEQDCECPLCYLEQKCEEQYLDFFLGGSVMEPNVRKDINEKGFCKNHFYKLSLDNNKLGLALVTHTYSKELIKNLDRILQDTVSSPEKTKKTFNNFTIGKLKSKNTGLYKLNQFIEYHLKSCALCDKLDRTMNRYALTIYHLLKTEEEFKKKLFNSKGFCLNHFKLVLKYLPNNKSPQAVELLNGILKLQLENMNRIEEELEWFTKKFDYRNAKKPWNNSQDSLERMLNKLFSNMP